MTDEEINELRNSWRDKVSQLRLRSIPHWSVKQRKMPLISTTELYIRAGFNDLIGSIYLNLILQIQHQLFLFSDKNIRNIIHWGNNNHLAVILNEAVRIIDFDNFKTSRSFNRKYEIKLKNKKIGACLRWSRAGSYIAIAAEQKEIEIWNPVTNKVCLHSFAKSVILNYYTLVHIFLSM